MAHRELTAARLRAILGAGTRVGTAPDGVPRAVPESADACALVLRTATQEQWRVRIEGGARWSPPDAPADLVLTTAGLRRVTDVSATDLVATAEAGVPWSTLRRRLADHGAWVAHDLPGDERTLGSAVVTGTAGPLRAGFGALRDHILGITLVTGDGRIVQTGGRVVKNVAGYDLAKLMAGSFGAFGVVTSLHLRLRAVPRADMTLTATGTRDHLLDAAHAVLAAGRTPAAMELLSPRAGGTGSAGQWMLAVRMLGMESEVAAQRDAITQNAGLPFTPHGGADAADLWRRLLSGTGDDEVTLRLATLPEGLADALDLVAHHLDETVDDWISVTVPSGQIRWSGAAGAEDIALLRRNAAEREVPLTIERAPWPVRKRLGHFGAYRAGVGRLVDQLRRSFDPGRVLTVAVGAEQ
ncbi:MAG: FAD-binding oxidoreductase [Gemmatimonadetes bacterium]|nr:FAD-binding oxidoreductase [Gemmatimonadota bacterium]